MFELQSPSAETTTQLSSRRAPSGGATASQTWRDMGTTKVFCQQLGEMKLYMLKKIHCSTHARNPPSNTEHFLPQCPSAPGWGSATRHICQREFCRWPPNSRPCPELGDRQSKQVSMHDRHCGASHVLLASVYPLFLHFEVKMYKTHQVRTTFGSWDV